MQVTPFHLHERPPRDLETLTLTFKRYQPAGSLQTGKQQVALVLTHCVGTHKETWEPVIQHLFALQTHASAPVQIAEVWSMDSPNHGEGGVVNQQPLLKRTQGITGFDWARGVDVLYRSGLIGPKKVIGIGHSAGACIMILVASLYSLMEIPYCSLILVEPPMVTREFLDNMLVNPGILDQIVQGVKVKRDNWPSREDAYAWFRKRFPWKVWHKDAFDLFINYGLQDLPTASYPDKTEGVTLSCTREQEAAGYIYHDDGLESLEILKRLCHVIPIHVTFGTRIDLVAAETQDAIVDPKQGRIMKSVVKIEGAGHQLPQEKPFEVAKFIWDSIINDLNSTAPKLKSNL
ncbi:hypothetical protein AN958_00458 [Leucoagaricus sp. SymC.cos]|nr:hypothetical protein AN958_00458 [Leucoagaricus sp. SymC.cos]